ncbi:39S ribosomal protein L52, mitochondrial [Heterodontus francisci]|uniref:39S ribosomal protein L52, mitochondrial n=1 Tax=Heterodontus francisci TaxID=7792 RepID=UPI00355C70BC
MWRCLCVPLIPGVRFLSCGTMCRAGSQWRLGLGMARSGTEYGPMTDLPDWSFADGRPAPPLKGQTRRQQETEKMARRILMLTNEMERGMERWEGRQADLLRQEEERQFNQPKAKGAKQGESSRVQSAGGAHPSRTQ